MIGGFLVTFIVRGLAIKFRWSLPVFRKKMKREPGQSEPQDPSGD
jgi:hypothetical protein